MLVGLHACTNRLPNVPTKMHYWGTCPCPPPPPMLVPPCQNDILCYQSGSEECFCCCCCSFCWCLLVFACQLPLQPPPPPPPHPNTNYCPLSLLKFWCGQCHVKVYMLYFWSYSFKREVVLTFAIHTIYCSGGFRICEKGGPGIQIPRCRARPEKVAQRGDSDTFFSLKIFCVTYIMG